MKLIEFLLVVVCLLKFKLMKKMKKNINLNLINIIIKLILQFGKLINFILFKIKLNNLIIFAKTIIIIIIIKIIKSVDIIYTVIKIVFKINQIV